MSPRRRVYLVDFASFRSRTRSRPRSRTHSSDAPPNIATCVSHARSSAVPTAQPSRPTRIALAHAKIIGVKTAVGASQTTQPGSKRTLTTRNAVTTAIVAPIMRLMWFTRRVARSAGRPSRRRSLADIDSPIAPNATSTSPPACPLTRASAPQPTIVMPATTMAIAAKRSIHAPPPVISIAIEPKTKADEEKMGLSLMKLAKEDPSLKVSVDQESGQTLIGGMGELHLDIIKQRLFREFGVDTTVGKPQVAYRETILGTVENETKYAKQTGGRGQFGHVLLRVEPLPPGSGVEFADETKGGVIPKEYIPAVEDGVLEALEGGILAGFPVIDMKVAVFYGSYHEVDSSEIAFKIAGSMCVKEACRKAKLQLLEPIMAVEVVCPDDFVSNIVGDLNRRRARIMGMEPRGGAQAIKAEVPLSEMFGYSTDLRSSSQGRAVFTMEYHHYSPVPTHIAESIATK